MLRLRVRKQLREWSVEVDTAFPIGTSVLLGGSGHGKTTILNMVAGLMRPDHGTITIGERVLFDSARDVSVAVEQRNVGYVFQDFALFPHLSTFDNVAYGLRARHLPCKAVRERVEHELERFQITSLKNALPANISAGQRQRVALARTLVLDPVILLLDEPLSALDQLLRAKVRCDLCEIFAKLNVPTLIVTHDPEDAKELADRILVVEQGRIRQVASYQNLEGVTPSARPGEAPIVPWSDGPNRKAGGFAEPDARMAGVH